VNNFVLASSATEAVALEETNVRLAETGRLLDALAAKVLSAAATPLKTARTEAEHAKLAEFARVDVVPLAAAIKSALEGVKGADVVISVLAVDHHARLVDALTAMERQSDPVFLVHSAARLQEAASVFLAQAQGIMVPVLAQNPMVRLAGILPERTFQAEVVADVDLGATESLPTLADFDALPIPQATRN
jgi:hypothetical protein